MGFPDTRPHQGLTATSLLHTSLSVDLRDHSDHVDAGTNDTLTHEEGGLVGLPPFSMDVGSLSLASGPGSSQMDLGLTEPSSALFNTSSSTTPTSATVKENTGRWTSEEHNMFLEGLKLHGKGWKAIAQMIKTRTVVQIRTHAQKYFQKLAKAQQNGGCTDEVLMDTRSTSATASMPIDIPKNAHFPAHSSTSHPKKKKKGAPSKRKTQQAGLDTQPNNKPSSQSSSKRLAIDVSSNLSVSAVGSPSPSSIMDYSVSATTTVDATEWVSRMPSSDVEMESFSLEPMIGMDWFVPNQKRTFDSSSNSDMSSDYNSESEKDEKQFMFPSDTSLLSDPHPFPLHEMEPTFDFGDTRSVFDPALDEDAFVSALLADSDSGGVW